MDSAAAPALNATLVARHDLTEAVARFLVRPDAGTPTFTPGQYLALGLPVDGRLLLRPYSTASAPDAAEELEFLIRLVPGGTLTPRLWALRPGDRLRLGSPKGLFRLRPGDRRTHVLVATGTGLAPFVSMIAALRRTQATAPVTPRALVVHGVARADELAYRDQFEAWAADQQGRVGYVPAVSRPQDPVNVGWTGPTGRLNEILGGILDAHAVDPADAVAYLCGNPDMIAASTIVLRDRGFPAAAVVSEHYWPPTDGGSSV